MAAQLDQGGGKPGRGHGRAAGVGGGAYIREDQILPRLPAEGTRTLLQLGPVQVIRLHISHPSRCASAFSPQQPRPLFAGEAELIYGHAGAPVMPQRRLGWWAGPRTSQSWPLIGDLPGISATDRGEFAALSGLHGSWLLYLQQYAAVSAVGLPPGASVDEASPRLAGPVSLYWDSNQPMQPVTIVTNATAMSTWQNWLVASGILLGIGGSLLASLLYEWTRPARSSDAARPPPSARNSITAAAALLALALIIKFRKRRS